MANRNLLNGRQWLNRYEEERRAAPRRLDTLAEVLRCCTPQVTNLPGVRKAFDLHYREAGCWLLVRAAPDIGFFIWESADGHSYLVQEEQVPRDINALAMPPTPTRTIYKRIIF